LALESVAERFALWRRKKTKGSGYQSSYGTTRSVFRHLPDIRKATRALRLSGSDLKKRRWRIEAHSPS